MNRQVYIASSSQNALACRQLGTILMQDGHRIASTWHQSDYKPDCEVDLTQAEREKIVHTNLKDLRYANTLVMLYHPKCKSTYVEAGLAIAWGHKVVLVGGVNELPLMLFQHGVRSVVSALDVVAELRDLR